LLVNLFQSRLIALLPRSKLNQIDHKELSSKLMVPNMSNHPPAPHSPQASQLHRPHVSIPKAAFKADQGWASHRGWTWLKSEQEWNQSP